MFSLLFTIFYRRNFIKNFACSAFCLKITRRKLDHDSITCITDVKGGKLHLHWHSSTAKNVENEGFSARWSSGGQFPGSLVSSRGGIGQTERAGSCRSLSGDVKRRSGAERSANLTSGVERSGAVSRPQTGGGNWKLTESEQCPPRELNNEPGNWTERGQRAENRSAPGFGWIRPICQRGFTRALVSSELNC